MIAKRYLCPGKGEGFIFVVAGFSVGAVALGVAALIIVMSVMNGFRAELFDKIVGLNGHAIIQGYDGRLANWQEIADAARKTPGVTSATAADRAAADGFGQWPGRRRAGPRHTAARTSAPTRSSTARSVAGDLQLDHAGQRPRRDRRRGWPRRSAPIPGARSRLISPEGRSTPVGTVPRIVTYTVGAIFEVGIYEYDKAFVIMPMQDAQTLLMLGDEVGMVEVQVDRPRQGRRNPRAAAAAGARAGASSSTGGR